MVSSCLNSGFKRLIIRNYGHVVSTFKRSSVGDSRRGRLVARLPTLRFSLGRYGWLFEVLVKPVDELVKVPEQIGPAVPGAFLDHQLGLAARFFASRYERFRLL